MNDVGELREAMHAFDPGWSLDVAQVRATAVRARRRSRTRRAIGSAVALVVAVAGTGSVCASSQLDGGGRPAPAAAADRSASRSVASRGVNRAGGASGGVPSASSAPSPETESASSAATAESSRLMIASRTRRDEASVSGLSEEQIGALSTHPAVRSDPPPQADGEMLPIGWESAAVQVTVLPAQGAGTQVDVPMFCTRGASGTSGGQSDPDNLCLSIRRDRDGWLAQRRWEDRDWATRAGLRLVEAPRVWLIDAPLSKVVVTYGGTEVPTVVHQLGGEYLAVTALVPLGDKGGFLPGVQAWGVDDHGVVVAYSQD